MNAKNYSYTIKLKFLIYNFAFICIVLLSSTHLALAIDDIDMSDMKWSISGPISNMNCVSIALMNSVGVPNLGWKTTSLCSKKDNGLVIKTKMTKAQSSCVEIFGTDAYNREGSAKNQWLCSDKVSLAGVKFSNTRPVTAGSNTAIYSSNKPGPVALKCIQLYSSFKSSLKYLCGPYNLDLGSGVIEKPIFDQATDVFSKKENILSRFRGKICKNEIIPSLSAQGYDCKTSWGKQLIGFPMTGKTVESWGPFAENLSNWYLAPSLIDGDGKESAGQYRYREGGSQAPGPVQSLWYPPSAAAFFVDPLTRDNEVTSIFLTSPEGETQYNSDGSIKGKSITGSMIFQNAPNFMVKPFSGCSDPRSDCHKKVRLSFGFKVNHAYMYPFGQNYEEGFAGSADDPFPDFPKKIRPSSQAGAVIAFRDPVAKSFFYFNVMAFNQGRKTHDKHSYLKFDLYSGKAMLQLFPGLPTEDGINYAQKQDGSSGTLYAATANFKHFEVTISDLQFRQLIQKVNGLIEKYNLQHPDAPKAVLSSQIENYEILNAGVGGEIFEPKENTGYCTSAYTKVSSGKSFNKCFVALGFSVRNFRVSYSP